MHTQATAAGAFAAPDLRPRGLGWPPGSGEWAIFWYNPQKVTVFVCKERAGREVPGFLIFFFFFHLETGSISDMIAGDFHQPN